jgi:hypothetical protein
MRFRNIALVFLMLALAVPAFAQEQRASIEGIIKDASGAVMPGVTVEAKNLAVGSVVSTVTDANGAFRFPALAAGTYEVTATLQGFNPAKNTAVPITLGQIKKVDLTLSVAGVTESVQVTGESPLVDVRQSARTTSIRGEQIDLLPRGRDFSSLVTQAPGTNNEAAKLGGISIDGASGSENRFIVDGIETTNLQNGIQGKGVNSDFIEEVQVKSSGYTAEYGGATGGVINAITKSGTNSWRGNAAFYWESDKLDGGYRPTLRLDPVDSNKAQYWTFPEDTYNRTAPGVSLGGPIWKDKAWFFAAYQPTRLSLNRAVSQATAGTATANASNTSQKWQQQYFSANQTSQIGNNLRTRIAYNNSWQKQEGRLPSQNGSTATTALLAINDIRPNWALSGQADWVVKPTWFIGARAGYYKADLRNEGVPSDPWDQFSFSNIGLVGTNGVAVPASYQHPTGWSNIVTNSSTTRDQQTRLSFQLDSTFYVNAGGQHTIKGGIQFDRVGNNVLTGQQANVVLIRWGTPLSGFGGGPFGYYEVRSNGVYPKQGIITQGDVHSNNIGLFVQDAWSVNNKLTINLGLRTENEEVPAYATGSDIPAYGIKFPFSDKLAPRLGFAYDVKGDGRWKVFGSWGIFYDIMKLELPRGSFGGDKWLSYYYSLDTYAFDTLVSGSSCPPACSGTLIRGPIDFRHPSFGSDAVQPGLKPMQSQEFAAGGEHQLSAVTAVSVRYVRKWLVRAIEDTGSLDADGNEIYIIANPSEGLTSLAYTNPNVPMPKPKRQYDSVEFAFTKNLSNNWYFRGSYLWSRLYGNYSGLSQSDENGRVSPNVGRSYDYPAMMFDGQGQPVYGPLGTDRPNQFKAQFIYQFKFGTSVGVNAYLASGIPVSREVAILPTSNYPVQYLGRLSDGRMPTYSQTDMNISHSIKMGHSRQLQFEFIVSNLFNQSVATNKFVTQLKAGQGINFSEADFYQGKVNFAPLIAALPQDPRFLMANAYQSPISGRFGIRFLF